MRNKRLLTEELVQQLPEHLGVTASGVYPLWWANLRSAGGMRLTDLGYTVFCEHFDFAHYEYSIDHAKFNLKTLVMLDRKLQMPYYIQTQKKVPVKLSLFGSKEAVWINIYGNLDKFLENYR